MLPTFIGIGPGRSATSMIYELLLQHPEVFMASGTKETSYFSLEYHRGLDWYKTFFRSCSGAKAIGEISTSYFYEKDAPERIWKALPNVRLFTCLRNPFDRLRSVYIYRKRAKQIPLNISLEKAIHEYPDLVTDNYYSLYLDRYFTYFQKNQILISLYDDLLVSPEAFVRSLLSFIGVNLVFESPIIYEHINPSALPRSRLVGLLAAQTAKWFRQRGFLRILDKLKRTILVRQLILKKTSPAIPDSSLILSPVTLKRLHQEWEPQIRGVERLIGRPLNHWLDPYN